MSDERQFNAMRLLGDNPDMTQRELAEALGVSLGVVNDCLKTLDKNGWVKLESFQSNPKKLGYLHLLTHEGWRRRRSWPRGF